MHRSLGSEHPDLPLTERSLEPALGLPPAAIQAAR